MILRNLNMSQRKSEPGARWEDNIPGLPPHSDECQPAQVSPSGDAGGGTEKLQTSHPAGSGICKILLRFGLWFPLAHGILLEFRSCLYRIRRLCNANVSLLGDFGPAWITLSSGHLWRCEATLARIRDTQDMRANHPEATIIDVDHFLEGWIRGARWAVCGTRSPENGTEHMENLASENVIQQIEALQVPKQGRFIYPSGL